MAVTMSVISTVAAVGAAAVSAVSQYKNEKAQEAVNKYNEAAARDDAERVKAEYAMNAGLRRASARKQIAEAENQMGAVGNIGSSERASVYDAYLNLSSDLAAMQYQYDNTAIKYLNEAENHKYNSKIAKMNASGAKLAGYLNVTAAATSGYGSYSNAGGKYGYSYFSSNKSVADINGNVIGRVGGYGTYQP